MRTIKASVDPAEDSWRQTSRRQWHPTLPPPAPAAVVTAITFLEVKAGMRPTRQLEPLCHHSLWPVLWTLPDPPSPHPIPVLPRPLAVAIREPTPGLVDVAVVVDFGGRPHALGLRLDGARGFWELVELDYATGPTRHLPAPQPPDAGEPLPYRHPQARRRTLPIDLSPRPWHDALQRERPPLDSPGIELA